MANRRVRISPESVLSLKTQKSNIASEPSSVKVFSRRHDAAISCINVSPFLNQSPKACIFWHKIILCFFLSTILCPWNFRDNFLVLFKVKWFVVTRRSHCWGISYEVLLDFFSRRKINTRKPIGFLVHYLCHATTSGENFILIPFQTAWSDLHFYCRVQWVFSVFSIMLFVWIGHIIFGLESKYNLKIAKFDILKKFLGNWFFYHVLLWYSIFRHSDLIWDFKLIRIEIWISNSVLENRSTYWRFYEPRSFLVSLISWTLYIFFSRFSTMFSKGKYWPKFTKLRKLITPLREICQFSYRRK